MELLRQYEANSDDVPVTDNLELLHQIDLEAASLSNWNSDQGERGKCVANVFCLSLVQDVSSFCAMTFVS